MAGAEGVDRDPSEQPNSSRYIIQDRTAALDSESSDEPSDDDFHPGIRPVSHGTMNLVDTIKSGSSRPTDQAIRDQRIEAECQPADSPAIERNRSAISSTDRHSERHGDDPPSYPRTNRFLHYTADQLKAEIMT